MNSAGQHVRPPDVPQAAATYSVLDALLTRAARRARRLACGVAAGATLSMGSAALIFGGLVLNAYPRPWVRSLVLGIFAAVAVGPWPFALTLGLGSTQDLIRRLTLPSETRLRSLLLSAIELRAELRSGSHVSASLVRGQAQDAERAATGLALSSRLPARTALRTLAVGLGFGLVLATLVARNAFGIGVGLRVLRDGAPSTERRIGDEAITGDLELTFVYPAYTRLETQTLSGTDGRIDAPLGTEVSLRARADRAVGEADLVLNGVAQRLVVNNGRQLLGAFTVAKSGEYFFRFLAGGRVLARGASVPIHALADEPPRVTVSSPPAQLEVPASQVVGLQYQASDDYGLSLIELVYRLPGAQTETKRALRKPSETPRHLDGHADLDLGTMRLFPGDELSYAIEATDNDAVGGPKSTRSAPHTIHIYSQAEHHQNALGRVRALWERLLGLLGDRLEEQGRRGSDLSSATERARQLSRDLEQEARAELKEHSGVATLSTALTNIARDERRRLAATVDASEDGVEHSGLALQRALAEEVSGLERDVLYLEALLDETSGADLLALANELADRKKDIATLLDRYRRGPTTALKTQIEALLSRLKERTAQLGARVQQLAKEHADQHFNREALTALRKGKDLDASVAETRQLVESGDLEGALKSLDQLGSTLDSLRKEIAHSQNDGPNQYAALGKELVKFKTQLEQLKADQEELAKSTASIRDEARRAREQRTPMTGGQIAKLQAEARVAQQALGLVPPGALPQGFASDEGLPEARERIAGLTAALESRDFAQALRSTNEALRAVSDLTRLTAQGALYDAFDSAAPSGHSAAVNSARGHLAEASSPLRRIRDTLQALFPDEREQLSDHQRAKLEAIAKQQDRASAASSQLGRQLQQIAQDAPVFDRGAQDTLNQAGERMRSAGGKLGRKDPAGALEEQRGAIGDLERLAQAMQGQGGSPAAGGVPNPFAVEQESDDGDGSNGGGSPPEAVVVPDADQYQVPAQFRRDILDAMKQAPPVSYQDQVKRYYQEIVK